MPLLLIPPHPSQVSTFIMMYRTHCQRILDTVIRANFDEVGQQVLSCEYSALKYYDNTNFYFTSSLLVARSLEALDVH